ncbi:FAD-dependent oxidoreductase [Bogoriella caseilytica]|uniref:Glycine/D-amino acid oxidase-like deaminating enzyme n=1 Tax=Bogoriella caseilytica TaxID=56055 RepID=A0A3N2BGL7_9MICO|nr:FAD-dependent oxidoreductase [Bogoriella caseilytica]ROR74387.1 glycine/D-amino acid oxidase-like deaminating enzyme [Bogoriella caseilytica]
MATTMRSLWFDSHPLDIPAPAVPLPGSHYDVVVAGGGLTGLTTAVLLARAGKKVAVLEARSVGAVATGNTTAKVSLLQGTTLSGIAEHQSTEVLQAYVTANRDGQAWLAQYLDERDVGYQRRSAWTYATTAEGAAALEKEAAACHTAELPVTWQDTTELPYPVSGALSLDEQIQVHPLEVLGALAGELHERGGVIYEGVRLLDAKSGSPLSVHTTGGSLRTEQLVLATGVPVLDRGGYFARLTGHRSYALAFRMPAETGSAHAAPQGMYLSADAPGRSLRTAPVDGEEYLLVGGNGHMVGRANSPRGAVLDLEAWTRRHFPGAARTHSWSAQDYRAADHVPYIGALPRGGGNIYLATAFNKWGMTNGVAAALALSSEILGGQMAWADTLTRRSVTLNGVLSGVMDNLDIGARMGTDWASAELNALPDYPPSEGHGVVGRSGGKPVGESTVDGVTRRVSAVCPHLGGVLRWNDAECSWDCPLHASRFAADGTLLEGPAVSDLPVND